MARATTRSLGTADHQSVGLLDEVVQKARSLKASDIHIEPKENHMRVRFRIDGVLVEHMRFGVDDGQTLVSRIKVLSKMDITSKRTAQDGTFEIPGPDARPMSLRASTFPAVNGEKCVLRIVSSGKVLPLEELGMAQDQLASVKRFCARTGGLVLVTGPTGSGKTSTLYSMIGEVDTAQRNVVTLEDPIEAVLGEITQGQVDVRGGFTFADGLRSILRQDPDVILVGEIRDRETTEIAVQASLTGHLVLSTMHTNSTVATITRLLDVGIEPHIVASALEGVIAQRLMRRVCRCAENVQLEQDVCHESGITIPKGSVVPIAKGCRHCLDTGYRGRAGCYEVVEVDDDLRDLIKENAGIGAMRRALVERNVLSMRDSAVQFATSGGTTLGEVLRVT